MNHHHPNREQHQNQQRRGWGFSYFGETPEVAAEEVPREGGASFPLARAAVGTRIWIVGFQGKGGINRLLGMGLTPGVELQIISSQPSGSVIVAIQGSRLGLGAGMAQKILVSDRKQTHQKEETSMGAETTMHLRDMAPGTTGRVVGYDKTFSGYKGKLLSMGLTPGTEFLVIRVAPLGDPVEINVRAFHLSLRKQEADALIVEEVSNNA
ncbi:MAG: FeoA family protein [Cyanobacteriota bacterium]|nr:FeoA family protein [Cyanobacteriota bacterium]